MFQPATGLLCCSLKTPSSAIAAEVQNVPEEVPSLFF
jgi:hypothetical protein